MYFALSVVLALIASPWLRMAAGETTPPIPIGDCVGRDEELRELVMALARQVAQQQFALEEKTRLGQDSGLKSARLSIDGSRPYHADSVAKYALASIHDHSDHCETVGMGEVSAVLNGVEFNSRHNDYMMVKPSTTSTDYHATEPIQYPPVPQAVLDAATENDQIVEMRKWFQEWQGQSSNPTRDYTQHFKPLICYMEGAWTLPKGSIDEPFESDRHHINAKSWTELAEKIMFLAAHGGKDNQENLAYLPTKIYAFNDTNGEPIFAQWNYRILCHPVKKEIKLSYFKSTKDLHTRLARKQTMEKYDTTRSARYYLSEQNYERFNRIDILDEIMQEIPGKDNYPASIEDDVFGMSLNDMVNGGRLNAGYYHSWYTISETGAMGNNLGKRGFNDRNLYVALNTRPEIAPIHMYDCDYGQDRDKGECARYSVRMSYAIPLEIIWLTPLRHWNPYNIEYKGKYNSELAKEVTANGRSGGFTASTAYDGTHSKKCYMTPAAFFDSGDADKDNADDADTMEGVVGVLDANGNVRSMTASGVRIHLPLIPSPVNATIRLRYPIMPISEEGSMTFKEVKALQTMVMDIPQYSPYFEVDPGLGGTGQVEETVEISTDEVDFNGLHFHTLEISDRIVLDLFRNPTKTYTGTSSFANGHIHTIVLRYDTVNQYFIIVTCDNRETCWDGHATKLKVAEAFVTKNGLPVSMI